LTVFDLFQPTLDDLFYDKQKDINEQDQAKTIQENEERIEIDTTFYLNQAYEVLSQCAQGENVQYTDVAFSLALTTGRRSVEIMQSGVFWKPTNELAWSEDGKPQIHWQNVLLDPKLKQPKDVRMNSKYWLIDEAHTLCFKGTAKAKGDFAESLPKEVFFVTTLVPAHLVLAGIQWLTERNLRIDPQADKRAVNTKYGKPFERAKVRWLIHSGITIHQMRAIYFLCLAETLDLDYRDYKKLSGAIGHMSGAADINYETFDLEDGALTFIEE
jgi:hypothetical protein